MRYDHGSVQPVLRGCVSEGSRPTLVYSHSWECMSSHLNAVVLKETDEHVFRFFLVMIVH